MANDVSTGIPVVPEGLALFLVVGSNGLFNGFLPNSLRVLLISQLSVLVSNSGTNGPNFALQTV